MTVLLGVKDETLLGQLAELPEPEFHVIGTEGDCQALLSTAERLQPDAVILDCSLPSLNGLEALDGIRRASPHSRIVVLTPDSSKPLALTAQGHTSAMHLPKAAPNQALIEGLRSALEEEGSHQGVVNPPVGYPVLVRPLTQRQQEVLRLIADGRSNKEIALALTISVKTVEFHKYRLMAQVQARSTAELISIAIRRRLVPDVDS